MFDNIDTNIALFKNVLDNKIFFTEEESSILNMIFKAWYRGNNNELTDIVRFFNLNNKSSGTNIMRKVYYYQQKYFKDRNIKELKLYRGIGLKDNIKIYNSNKFESWSSDKEMATWFAKEQWLYGYKNSGVLIKNIDVKDILFSQLIYEIEEYYGSEFVCNIGNLVVDDNNFIPFKFKRRR